MKFKNLILLIALVAVSHFGYSQSKTTEDTLRVEGNCQMCKERIELALDMKGVKFAQWSPETKNLIVAYRNDKVTEEEIRKAVAKAGHDNGDYKADDKVYKDLPFCCLYRDGNPHEGQNKGH